MITDVIAAFPEWVARFEGSVPTLYQDTKGLVTVGVGNLVDPVLRAVPLPFQRPDGTLAGEEEIAAEWARVKALPPGLVARRYATPDALRLSPEAIDALVRSQLEANVERLKRSFPDLDSYPDPAVLAIFGMAWAMGAGFAAAWPKFSAAVRARRWRDAADQCRIRDANVDRNEAHRALFLEAAEGV